MEKEAEENRKTPQKLQKLLFKNCKNFKNCALETCTLQNSYTLINPSSFLESVPGLGLDVTQGLKCQGEGLELPEAGNTQCLPAGALSLWFIGIKEPGLHFRACSCPHTWVCIKESSLWSRFGMEQVWDGAGGLILPNSDWETFSCRESPPGAKGGFYCPGTAIKHKIKRFY